MAALSQDITPEQARARGNLDSPDPVVVTWTMTTGVDQTGDVELGVTPGTVPGDLRRTLPSAG